MQSSWPCRLSIRNLAIHSVQAPTRYPTVQTNHYHGIPLSRLEIQSIVFSILCSTLENATSFGQVPLNQAVDIKLKTCVERGS